MEIVGMILFWIVLIVAVVIIPFGIAGTFIIVADALVFGIITGFERITIPFILFLLAIAIGMEVLEELFGAILAKKFGGSKWAMIGAIGGGLIGAIVGTSITPVIGTLLGGFLGSFLGALILEWIHSSDVNISLKAGIGALFGAIGGKIAKIIVAIAMVIMVGIRVF